MTQENNKPISAVKHCFNFILKIIVHVLFFAIPFALIGALEHSDIVLTAFMIVFGLFWLVTSTFLLIVVLLTLYFIITGFIKLLLKTSLMFLEKLLLITIHPPKTNLSDILQQCCPYTSYPFSTDKNILAKQVCDPKIRVHIPPKTLKRVDEHITACNKWRIVRTIQSMRNAPQDHENEMLEMDNFSSNKAK